jgi:hypothetical protein
MVEMTIRQIIEKVLNGQLRIPAFQRGFVWDANRVAYLMDSIYKNYPFGAILLWRTKERLTFERKLGTFDLPDAEPDFPVDYILDGQQRITSIFGVFQTEIIRNAPDEWTKIYFDYRANPDVQDSQFVALADEEVDPNRHFPLRSLFDTAAYRRATKDFEDALAEKVDRLQAVFKEARIPVQQITTENRTTVAIVFERVNQRGVELDTLQLLSAWTWSEDFDLQRKFDELALELEPFGFNDAGMDKDLLLRCCSAVLAGDPTAGGLVNLNGAVVRERFQEVINGLKGAIDFLRDNLNIHSITNIPYLTFLVPLTVFFSVPGNAQFRYTDDQRQTILKWFWRTCFSRRYNSQPIKSLQFDIEQIVKLKNRQPSRLGEITITITEEVFQSSIFKFNTVITKTFILLLAQKTPLSFVTGAPITLRDVLKDYNRNEFHHIYPKAFLKATRQDNFDNSCLSNFCFISRADNNSLSGDPPSVYRAKMPADVSQILERGFLPPNIFNDVYDDFIKERSVILAREANRLLG